MKLAVPAPPLKRHLLPLAPPAVRATEKYGHVLFLKIQDGKESVLPVFIGA